MNPRLRPIPAACLVALSLAPAAAPTARAQMDLPDDFVDLPVVGGVAEPTGLCFLPDGRLLVIEQRTARVRLLVQGAFAAPDPILTVPDVNSTGGEQGLLGVAADPGWPARPYVYVHYDHLLTPTVRISRFTASGDLDFTGNGSLTLDPASRFDVLTTIPDNFEIHNGGSILFGTDGMLYAAVGDDGVSCEAQRPAALGGKILRLDVSGLPAGPGGPPPIALLAAAGNPFADSPDSNARLVWAYGLRNPFSLHVDPATGALYAADVGAAQFEEVDEIAAGGKNFGWPFYEGPGRHTIDCPGADTSQGFVPPIHWYGRSPTTGACVIGGLVYRRPPNASAPFPAEYEGDLFFSDLYGWYLRRLKRDGATWVPAPAPGQPNPTDWGYPLRWSPEYEIGPDGAIWYTRLWTNYPQPDGQIRRVVSLNPVSVPPAARAGAAWLAPPWPSPARGEALLAFDLDGPRWVRLAIHDLAGRRVRTLVPGGLRGPGRHVERWDGRAEDGTALPAGVYVVRLSAAGQNFTRRLALVR